MLTNQSEEGVDLSHCARGSTQRNSVKSEYSKLIRDTYNYVHKYFLKRKLF